jgi:hypothetical protein
MIIRLPQGETVSEILPGKRNVGIRMDGKFRKLFKRDRGRG